MRPLIFLLATLAMCVPAVAQPIVLDVADGVYVLTVDGSSVTVQRARVPGVTPPPGDDDTTPPVDTDPTDLASLTTVSAAEFAKIPEGTGKQIGGMTVAAVYRKIAADLRSGEIGVAAAAESITQIRNALPVDWNLWKAETAKTWNALQDRGLIVSPATWADAADAVADGVSVQGADEFEIDEDEFLDNPMVGQLIKILLEMLGQNDGPLAKWLPIILALLPIILGGL